jgi:hypothetical protein
VENEAAEDSDDPVPKAFTALSFTKYAVLGERPVIVIGLVPSAGESAVYEPYVVPPSVESAYW